MLLTGLNVIGNVRFTETSGDTEVKDYVVDIFGRGGGTVLPDFGKLFFYLLPTGMILGADDATNNITTGFFAKFYDINNVEVGATATGKVDQYETEDKYIYKSTGSITLTNLSADTYVSKVDYFYRGDAGTTALDVNIITSTAPALSTLATAEPTSGNKGIMLKAGNDVTLSFEFIIEVAK